MPLDGLVEKVVLSSTKERKMKTDLYDSKIDGRAIVDSAIEIDQELRKNHTVFIRNLKWLKECYN